MTFRQRFWRWLSSLASLLWHAPGRTWAGMPAAAQLSLWFTAGAAMAWTVVSAGYVVFFKPDLTPDQGFWIIMAAHGLVLVALVALTMTELSLRAGKEGIALDIGHDDRPPPTAIVETRTEVRTTAPAADTGGELPESERIQ